MSAVSLDSAFAWNIDGGGAGVKNDDVEFGYGDHIDGINTAGSGSVDIYFDENGLYKIKPVVATSVTIQCNGTYIGRLGLGRAIRLGTSIPKEPTFNTTQENRRTLAGQMISGRGGYNYRVAQVDTRYKMGEEAMGEIKAAYIDQISKDYPLFMLFDDEARRLPFYRLYAREKTAAAFGFESGVHNKYLFSHKFEFEECF